VWHSSYDALIEKVPPKEFIAVLKPYYRTGLYLASLALALRLHDCIGIESRSDVERALEEFAELDLYRFFVELVLVSSIAPKTAKSSMELIIEDMAVMPPKGAKIDA